MFTGSTAYGCYDVLATSNNDPQHLRACGGPATTDEDRLRTAHHEENVVIDASTGVPLFSFSYR
jgi:hypothetical protein